MPAYGYTSDDLKNLDRICFQHHKYDCLDCRSARINAEVNDLQRRLRLNGYKPGEPIDWATWETMPPEHLAWQARLWWLGCAMHNLSFVV